MPQCQFLFSAVFVFQKSCTGNILGIGRNKNRSSYFYRDEAGDQKGVEEEPRGGHTMPRCGLGLAHA